MKLFAKHVCSVQNPMPVAREMHPVGSLIYFHGPIDEGFYRVVRHQQNGIMVSVFGMLETATSFGYPDPDCRGLILESILNGKRTFKRAADGSWQLQWIEKEVAA